MTADQKAMNVHLTHSLKNEIKRNEIQGTYVLLNTPCDSLENFVKYSILKSNSQAHIDNIKRQYGEVTYFTIQWYISELEIPYISKELVKTYYLLNGDFKEEDIKFLESVMGEETADILNEVTNACKDLLTYNIMLHKIFFKDK